MRDCLGLALQGWSDERGDLRLTFNSPPRLRTVPYFFRKCTNHQLLSEIRSGHHFLLLWARFWNQTVSCSGLSSAGVTRLWMSKRFQLEISTDSLLRGTEGPICGLAPSHSGGSSPASHPPPLPSPFQPGCSWSVYPLKCQVTKHAVKTIIFHLSLYDIVCLFSIWIATLCEVLTWLSFSHRGKKKVIFSMIHLSHESFTSVKVKLTQKCLFLPMG